MDTIRTKTVPMLSKLKKTGFVNVVMKMQTSNLTQTTLLIDEINYCFS